MPIIKRDFETRSAVNLKKVGARRYAADPTTSVLCICYAVDDGPIESFVPEDGKPVPDVFIEAAHNPDWSVAAHNDPFESAIEEYILGPRLNWPWVPIERHICTMAMARYHGLPGELSKVAALLDLPIQKDREGARLMLQLCRPRKPRRGEDPTQLYWPEITPEKLARLIVYCKNDVAVEREIFRRLPLLPDEEHRLWRLDRKINVRGFRCDLEFATTTCKLVEAEKAHINSEIVVLTDGAVAGFTKLNDMREFVNARGHNMTALDKRAVTAVLAHDPDDTVRTVLELRQASGNTAVAKYAAVLAAAFPDQRIYGLLNYYGAHTGRWSSAGFNIHNLPREDSNDALAAIDAIRRGDLEQVRTFGPPLEVIARLARGVVVASENRLLLAGDFSVVEPRVASWFSGETWKLDNFRAFDETGNPLLDAHRVVGARMRGQPVDPTDDEARQHGKTVHMALNYGGGVRVWREHVPDDPRGDEAIKIQEIDKFRQLHPAQTQFMYNLDKQAPRCVQYRQPVRGKRHSFEMDGDTLILRLPSGRPLFYPRARLKLGRFGKNVVAYHNPAKNREDEMWYGAWFAHLVSATSRDLLVNALFNLDTAGFDIILHVHDEIVAEIDPANVEHDRERFKACMLAAPAWAKGLPLAAKVRVGPRYIKTDAPIEIKADTIVEGGASIGATEVAPIQPQDGCFGDIEAVADSDFHTTEPPGGSEFEHNLDHAENDDSDERVEAHICAQCHLNPPDGSEQLRRLSDNENLWLHKHCEDAFIRRRMAEEGISWSTMPGSTAPAPSVEKTADANGPSPPAPPPPSPTRQINGGAAPAKAPPPLEIELTRLTKDGGPLTKQISLSPDGTLKKDNSACVMVHGTAERVRIAGVAALGALIEDLAPSQALALGTLRADLPDKVEITTTRLVNGVVRPDIIARTGANIIYCESAFALLDYDSKGISPAVAAELKRRGGFWPALLTVVPALGNAARVIRPSTSAGLSRADTGEALPGSDGVHVYVAEKDGADSERFLRALHDRCWLGGLGWMMVSTSGALLERSIVDRMVGGPERLVFEGGPVLLPPLQQDRESRRPIAVDGATLDTVAVCPPLSIVEQTRLNGLRAKERERLAPEMAKAREAFVETQARKLVARTGMSEKAARQVIIRQCEGILRPDVELPLDNPELVGKTVGDVLADPEHFEGETLADPLEGVDYGPCKAKIMRRADGTPWIHSFAHGHTVYELKLDATAVRKAMEKAAKDDVVVTFARLTVAADLDAIERADLRQLAKTLSDAGLRVIDAVRKEALQKQAALDARRKQAEQDAQRRDLRPQVRSPFPDEPWLPQMSVLNDVIGKVTAASPPARDIDDDAMRTRKLPVPNTHAFTQSEVNVEPEETTND